MLSPLFVSFYDSLKGIYGSIIEHHVVMGTLKSNCVEERRGRLGSFRRFL